MLVDVNPDFVLAVHPRPPTRLLAGFLLKRVALLPPATKLLQRLEERQSVVYINLVCHKNVVYPT